jgi:hypothetical protein
MRTAPLIPPPPSKPGAAVPPAHVGSLPNVPAATPMDREFILRNQIAERYISGRLPLKGAQDFERYCQQHPELMDELGMPARVHAGLRLLEAGGQALPWEGKPRQWWEKLPVLIAAAAVALLALIALAVLASRLSARDSTIAGLQQRVAEQPLDPATSTRSVRLIPSRTAPSRHNTLVLGGSAQMNDLKIDMSWSKFSAFRVTIDRMDQGRVEVLHNMLRDSNGDVRIALNSTALGPGSYQLSLEGMTLHGEAVAQAWITVGIVH